MHNVLVSLKSTTRDHIWSHFMLHFTTFHNVSIYLKLSQKLVMNFVFTFIAVALFIWRFMLVKFYMLGNVNVSGQKKIAFQGCRFHWSSSVLMTQPKQSWRNWHSCVVKSLWKLFVSLRFPFTNINCLWRIGCCHNVLTWIFKQILYTETGTWIEYQIYQKFRFETWDHVECPGIHAFM